MEPINQKERSAIFIQFLLIYSISLIVVGFLVYFNTRVVKKDYQVMKEKLAEMKSSTEFVDELNEVLGSSMEKISELDTKNENNFNFSKGLIYDELNKLKTNQQSNAVDSLKNKLFNISDSWIRDKSKLLDIVELNKEIERKNKTIEKIEGRLYELGVSQENVEMMKSTVQ